jgi:hypothetical protein
MFRNAVLISPKIPSELACTSNPAAKLDQAKPEIVEAGFLKISAEAVARAAKEESVGGNRDGSIFPALSPEVCKK